MSKLPQRYPFNAITPGGIIAGNTTTGQLTDIGAGTAGQVLLSNGSSIASWGSNGNGYLDVFVLGFQSSTGTWVLSLIGGTQFNNTVYNSSGTQNDQISYTVQLQPGTYTFIIYYVKGASYGIHNWKLNGTSIVTIDGYAASAVYNQVSTTTGVVVSGTGLVTLQLLLATKNASSSAYQSQTSRIVFVRTA